MAATNLLFALFVGIFSLGFVSGDKVLRVTPATNRQVEILRELESSGDKVDFWTHPSHIGRPVDIRVDDAHYESFTRVLRKSKIPFIEHISDVRKLLDESRARPHMRSGVSYHAAYHNLAEIHSKMQELASSRSDMNITVFDLPAKTYEQEVMKAIEIRGMWKANKPMFFIECGIHAREWISPATCMYFIDEMITKYGNDDSVTELLDKLDFVILPVFNVDGYKYTWVSNRYWRKNRRPNPGGCYGVDLNRNWGYEWGGAGTSADPCSSVYRGNQAFSEIETRNVRDYLTSQSARLKGFIDMHAYSQMWFTPWGYTGNHLPDDYAEQYRTAGIASEAITAVHGTYFQYGSSAQLLYAASGGSEDWVYATLNVKYAYSVELRDDGYYGFLLPTDQIIPTGEETFAGLKALARAMNV